MGDEVPAPSRSLTANELKVALDLLGATGEPEEERIRASGLARSTYQDAKRRLYTQGVLEERYVPSPAALSIPKVTFVLARPFAEDLQRQKEAWEAWSTTVVLWSGSGTLFAVLFGAAPEGPSSSPAPSPAPGVGEAALLLEVDTRTPSVPVYFDLEGALSRLSGTRGARRYPRHLPSAVGKQREGPFGGRSVPALLASLVRRPFPPEGSERQIYPPRPTSLPRSEQRLLQQGLAEWRVFPDLSCLPGFGGVRVSHLVFIHGELQEGAAPGKLFHTLVHDCAVYPFLLASDGTRVLLAGISGAPDPGSKEPRDPPRPRRSVVEGLSDHLTGITIAREEVGNLRVHLSHRYDRVVLG